MLKKIFPREDRFFDFFRSATDQLVIGAKSFKTLLENLHDAPTLVSGIKDAEHAADSITHETIALLHKTFITPLDREDIHQLIIKIDDILDFIDATAQRVLMYEVTKATPEMLKLADITVRSVEIIQKVVAELQNIKKPKEILKMCIELNRLENEADEALRTGVARLFKEENNVKELIKTKEILELMETATDRCEDVANIIEGIVLEYA